MGPLINTASNEYEPSISSNDTDFVFERNNGLMDDTMEIWHIRLGTANPAACLFHGHYVPFPYNGSYWYEAPCISWDSQIIYLTYEPFNMEALHYIHSSHLNPVAVSGDPNSGRAPVHSLSFMAAPNPVRFFAEISFILPRAGGYSLRVFNLLGQQVKVFAGTGKAGTNAVTWNVVAVPNGVYFYQLDFEGKMTTQRMVVLK